VHHEFAPECQTVNAAFYLEVLKRLRDRVRLVRREMWGEAMDSPYDNAPAHTPLIALEL